MGQELKLPKEGRRKSENISPQISLFFTKPPKLHPQSHRQNPSPPKRSPDFDLHRRYTLTLSSIYLSQTCAIYSLHIFFEF
ncbi:hypothetical protein QVD17_04094 [Tagetes erecta]|uniref:Uncharacterized protein n=1 Tax=Tagetes erecta TaxID=13708 RepID=A0AAD8PAH3_TARER|nr:hypothetical protein QVD17_04094 [Tagetes erecta]